MNVFYVGIDNPLTVAALAGGDDKTQISIDGGGGSITRVDTGKYNVRVSTVTDECTISVSMNGKIAASSTFRVRRLPTPQASIGGQPSGTVVSAKNLSNQPGLAAAITGFPLELKYEIAEYQIAGLDKEGDVIRATGKGPAFTDAVKKIILSALPGDIIQFGNIYCNGPDGSRMKLPSLIYNIN